MKTTRRGFLGRLGALVSGAFVGAAVPYTVAPPHVAFRFVSYFEKPDEWTPIYGRWGTAVHEEGAEMEVRG